MEQDDNTFARYENLLTWIDSQFTFPEVDALVPVNPMRWPRFAASSIVNSDPRIQKNDFLQPLNNLQNMFEYLSSSHNDSHYNDRLKKVVFDTCSITFLSEVDENIGPIIAGQYANDMAEQYVEEIIQDEAGMTMEDNFQRIIRLRGGPGSAYNHTITGSPLDGIGLYKEKIPKFQRTNPLTGKGVQNGMKRPIWSYKFFGGGFQFENIHSLSSNIIFVNLAKSFIPTITIVGFISYIWYNRKRRFLLFFKS